MTDTNADGSGSGAGPDRTAGGVPPEWETEEAGEGTDHPDSRLASDGAGVTGSEPRSLGADEQYCRSCGEVIKQAAEICPECGVRQQQTSTGEPPTGRWKAAVVGGIVSFFVGWIPLVGPLFGGVVAGYLRGSKLTESGLTGFLANFLASIPGVALVALFFVFGVVGAAMDGTATGELALGLVGWLVIFGLSFAYFYGFGALGGVIGSVLSSKGEPQ